MINQLYKKYKIGDSGISIPVGYKGKTYMLTKEEFIEYCKNINDLDLITSYLEAQDKANKSADELNKYKGHIWFDSDKKELVSDRQDFQEAIERHKAIANPFEELKSALWEKDVNSGKCRFLTSEHLKVFSPEEIKEIEKNNIFVRHKGYITEYLYEKFTNGPFLFVGKYEFLDIDHFMKNLVLWDVDPREIEEIQKDFEPKKRFFGLFTVENKDFNWERVEKLNEAVGDICRRFADYEHNDKRRGMDLSDYYFKYPFKRDSGV